MNGLLDAAAAVDPRVALLIYLGALDLWAVIEVLLSKSGRREKLLWIVIVILCPIIGCLFWFVIGPKAQRKGHAEGAGS